MRKYVLAILLISIGSGILFYSFYRKNKSVYTENVFSKEALAFEKTFSVFINRIKDNIKGLEKDFQDSKKITDSIYYQNTITGLFNENTYLKSVMLLHNDYKLGAIKDQNSIIFAIDSTKAIDIVEWKRYEKGKFISSWEESFNEKINHSTWFKKLVKNNNKIQWYFYDNDSINKTSAKGKDLFYLGYSLKSNDGSKVILLGVSRKSVIKAFDHFSRIDSLKLIIRNDQNDVWELNSGNPFPLYQAKGHVTDSITHHILDHYRNFEKKDQGIFNFTSENRTFWNAYKKLAPDSGLKDYIMSIPEYQILLAFGPKHFNNLQWLALAFLLPGILLLFVKKKKFYFPKKIEIPPLKELLKGDENRYLEFKSSSRWDYRLKKYNPELEYVISKTVAAFCNTDGGILLIGVDDDKNVIGLEKDFNTLKKTTSDYYEIHLRNNLHKLMGVKNVSKNIRIAFEVTAGNKVICKIKVLHSSEPIFIKTKNKNGQIEEKFYVRSGNSSQEIKSIIEINDYINTHFKN